MILLPSRRPFLMEIAVEQVALARPSRVQSFTFPMVSLLNKLTIFGHYFRVLIIPCQTGIYKVSKSIISYFDTQIVGEINPTTGEIPVIQAATSFTGDGIFSSDVYLSDGTSEWYLNTASNEFLFQ